MTLRADARRRAPRRPTVDRRSSRTTGVQPASMRATRRGIASDDGRAACSIHGKTQLRGARRGAATPGRTTARHLSFRHRRASRTIARANSLPAGATSSSLRASSVPGFRRRHDRRLPTSRRRLPPDRISATVAEPAGASPTCIGTAGMVIRTTSQHPAHAGTGRREIPGRGRDEHVLPGWSTERHLAPRTPEASTQSPPDGSTYHGQRPNGVGDFHGCAPCLRIFLLLAAVLVGTLREARGQRRPTANPVPRCSTNRRATTTRHFSSRRRSPPTSKPARSTPAVGTLPAPKRVLPSCRSHSEETSRPSQRSSTFDGTRSSPRTPRPSTRSCERPRSFHRRPGSRRVLGSRGRGLWPPVRSPSRCDDALSAHPR